MEKQICIFMKYKTWPMSYTHVSFQISPKTKCFFYIYSYLPMKYNLLLFFIYFLFFEIPMKYNLNGKIDIHIHEI